MIAVRHTNQPATRFRKQVAAVCCSRRDQYLLVARGLPCAKSLLASRSIPPSSSYRCATGSAFFFSVLPDISLGFGTVGELMNGLKWLLQQPIDLAEAILFRGFPSLEIGPPPWLVVVVIFGVFGYASGGRRLAALGVLGMTYLAVFDLWQLSMQTLAIVLVTVPLIAGLGLAVGLLASNRRHLEAALNPLFDLLQSTPQIAYLLPVVVLFGLGEVPALVAITVFAVPAMARCVIVGLQGVPKEVVEAGQMCGATERQLLWKVRFPAARPAILLGLNQSIMLTLAMVVIASLIGAKGLGHEVLIQLDRLWLGRALEVGLGIVVLAVVLDKLSRGLASAKREHKDSRRAERRRFLLVSFLCVFAAFLLGLIDHRLAIPQDEYTVSTAPFWDWAIKGIVEAGYDVLRAFRDGALTYVLLPIKRFLLWLPWAAVVAGVTVAGYAVGGMRLAATVAALSAFPAVTGLWIPTITTVYMLSIALTVCFIIGFPIGLLTARSDRVARIVIPICDVLQTLPSFIYLVPVVMLFRVGDVAAITATIGYSIVPIIRYTNLGLRGVSAETREAAIASGCSNIQLLTKVEIPMAMPVILLGVNQTIVFGLFTLSITALVGARDLSATIYRALAEIDPGQGIVAGICIAFLAILADRFIRSWIARRKARGSADTREI